MEPTKEPQEKIPLREKYPGIMDLPEAKKADWTRISENKVDYLNRLWGAFQFVDEYDFVLDKKRMALAWYEKKSNAEKTKSLKEKIKELLDV